MSVSFKPISNFFGVNFFSNFDDKSATHSESVVVLVAFNHL